MSEEQGKEMLVFLSEMILEQRLTNDKLGSINFRLERIEQRVENLEYQMQELRKDVSGIKRVVYNHEQRLKSLEHE
jgi:chromosome segregation ATPase